MGEGFVPRDVKIVVVNLAKRFAVLDDDTVFAITNLIDQDGYETDDPDDAAVAVGHLPDDSWVTFELAGFGTEEPVQ